jgi:hypothetical protein
MQHDWGNWHHNHREKTLCYKGLSSHNSRYHIDLERNCDTADGILSCLAHVSNKDSLMSDKDIRDLIHAFDGSIGPTSRRRVAR